MNPSDASTPPARPPSEGEEPAPAPPGILISKSWCLLFLCVPLSYMTYMSFVVRLRMPALVDSLMAMDMGPPPVVTQVLFATFHFWWLLPLGLALAMLDIARSKHPSGAHVGIVFVVACALCLAMQSVAVEGAAAPVVQMMEMLGQQADAAAQ